MKAIIDKDEITKLELQLLLEALYKTYGLDLRNSSQSSLLRRLKVLAHEYKKTKISELIPLVLYEEKFSNIIINAVTIQYSTIFRDPLFFKKIKKKVFPYLQTFPKIDIWIAGLANGEEVYSMLILLKEAGLLHKTTIYATDISKEALASAESGILKNGLEKEDINNYNKAGGAYSLSDYFISGYGKYKLKDELLSHVVYEKHNLAQDGPFISAQLVLCRNVMIYFNETLKERVVKLIDESLIPKGYFGIGMDEILTFTSSAKNYEQVKKGISLYRKE